MARRTFRRFHLQREADVSGVSGIGIVAEGVTFSTGKTVLNWTVSGKSSVAVYDSLDMMLGIHGHKGRTTVEWLDEHPLVVSDLELTQFQETGQTTVPVKSYSEALTAAAQIAATLGVDRKRI